MTRVQYTDSLGTLITQLDLLMKSPEPCRTYASDLLEILMLPEFLERDVDSLEKMFPISETHPGYISASCIALGLLAESEHIVSTSLAKTHKEIDHYYNTIALNYYLKSNLLTSHFSTKSQTTSSSSSSSSQLPQSQSQSHSHSSSLSKTKNSSNSRFTTTPSESSTNSIDEDTTKNSIACMLLGSLYLRTRVHVDLKEKKQGSNSKNKSNKNNQDVTSPTENNNFDYQAAFDYYKLAALTHNPIAQHK